VTIIAAPWPGLDEAVSKRTTAQWLESQGIETVHLGLIDASGVLREKRLSVAATARAFEHGWGFIDAIQWWEPGDQVDRGGGSVTAQALVDVETGRRYPFGADAALFLAEFSGPLCELSPRYQLGRMQARASAAGLSTRVGWEFECIVLEPGSPDDPLAALANNRCWSALTMAEESELLDGLVETLEVGGVPVDHVCAELGPGCLELATRPESALRAADSAALAKLYTKAYFAQRGLQVTFMAQLGSEFPGLGGHPSLSLVADADGTPALTGAAGTLTTTGTAAVAGIMALLPELMAMVAPYPNSYRRFGHGNWAPTTSTWGIGNYSCALRVVTDDPDVARLELRIPGADVSPHHGLAMFLGAALWGIEHDLSAPAPIEAPNDGRSAEGAPLPRDLTEAAQRFAQSDSARQLFGSTFVEHFAASRQAEVSACHRFVSPQERQRYLAYV
jgi:glutamine synthetase